MTQSRATGWGASRLALPIAVLAVTISGAGVYATVSDGADVDRVVTVHVPIRGGGSLDLRLPSQMAKHWTFRAERHGGASAYQHRGAGTSTASGVPAPGSGPLPGHASRTFPRVHSSAPGTVTTIAGGVCETYPAREATISPSRVAMDRFGTLFWVDQSVDTAGEHDGSSVLIRKLDRSGRVRTLAALYPPELGRSDRLRWPSASFLVTLVPDQHGGVIVNRSIADRGASTDYATYRDTPADTEIVHIRRDGSQIMLVGGLPPPPPEASGTTRRYGDGDPVAATGLDPVTSFAIDDRGGVYLAEGFEDGFFGSFIRYANRTSNPVVFYPDTPYQVIVPPGRIRIIAGTRPYDNAPSGQVNGVVDWAMSTRPAPAYTAPLFTIPKLELHDGVLYLLQVDWDKFNPATFKSRPAGLSAINLFSSTPITTFGQQILPGFIAPIAGNPLEQSGYSGDGGPAIAAQFRFDWEKFSGDFTIAPHGPLYITDSRNNRVRAVTRDGFIHTVAGNGLKGDASNGATATLSPLWNPLGATLDPQHRLVFADFGNARIRRLEHNGTLTTLAGIGPYACGGDGQQGTGPGLHDGAYFGRIGATAVDSHGRRYVADTAFNVIRVLDRRGRIIRTIGRPSRCAALVMTHLDYPNDYAQPDAQTTCPEVGFQSSDGSLASLSFANPTHIAIDSYDNLVVSDVDRVRYINLHGRSVSVAGVDIPRRAVRTLKVFPNRQVSVTGIPLFFIGTSPEEACKDQTAILQQVPPLVPDGVLPPGWEDALDGPPCDPVTIEITQAIGELALDTDGSVYVADPFLHVVDRIDPCGNLTVVAGNGQKPTQPGQGDGGDPLKARITPQSLAIDRRRHVLLISDFEWPAFLTFTRTARIRAVNLGNRRASLLGLDLLPHVIDGVAGSASCPDWGGRCSFGDGRQARTAAIAAGAGLLLAPDGRLYVAEALSGRLRVITDDGRIYGLGGRWPEYRGDGSASAPPVGYAGDGGQALQAWFAWRAMRVSTPASYLYPLTETDAWLETPALGLSRDGDLLVGDRVGRLRVITDIRHAPVHVGDALPQDFADAGEHFSGIALSAPVTKPDARAGALVPTMTATPKGVDVAASEGAGRGCDLWRIRANADGRGHDRFVFMGQPSAAGPPGRKAVDAKTGIGGEDCVVIAEDHALTVATTVRPHNGAEASSDATVATLASTDDGATWFGDPVAQAAQRLSGDHLGGAVLATGKSDSLLAYRNTRGKVVVARSIANSVFLPVTTMDIGAAWLGDLKALPTGGYALAYVHKSSGWNSSYDIAVATTRDLTHWNVAVVGHDISGQVGTLSPPALAVDSRGAQYVTWSDDAHVFVTEKQVSEPWTAPQSLVTSAVGILPTLTAPRPGHPIVAFYGAEPSTTATAADPYARWYVLTAVRHGASWAVRAATTEPVQYGAMCIGLQCRPDSTSITSAQPTAVAADCISSSGCLNSDVYGPNTGIGRPAITLDRTGYLHVVFSVAPHFAGNEDASVIGHVRLCDSSLLGLQRPANLIRCNRVAAPSNVIPPPDLTDVPQTPAAPPLPALKCSAVPPPFAPPARTHDEPAPKHHPKKTGVARPPAPAHPAAAIPVVLEPPVEPAYPAEQAPANAQQLNQLQQYQSSQQAQQNLQAGIALGEAEQVQEAREYAATGRRPEPPIALWLGALALTSIAGAGLRWRAQQRPRTAPIRRTPR